MNDNPGGSGCGCLIWCIVVLVIIGGAMSALGLG